MFNKYLESIAGISVYPMFSLMVFFTFFTVLIIYLLKVDNKHLEKLSEIPLNKSNEIIE